MANWLDGEVVEKRTWTDRLFSLRIRAPLETFTAGQFIRVGLEVDDEIIARPYSLVSVPGDELLEILFNTVPEGDLSLRLASLKPGAAVKISERASGFLTINEIPDVNHLWMLATGTGVGPFISCLKTEEPWKKFNRITLAYSVRSAEELAYLEDISKMVDCHPGQMSFVPFVTQEVMDGALRKRITASIENGELEDRVGIKIEAADSHVMMCGNSNMIQEATSLLALRGLRKHRRREPGHITIEKYH